MYTRNLGEFRLTHCSTPFAKCKGQRGAPSPTIVMLAKQCWRMINNPSSLVAYILKEKYFRNGGMIEAKLGQGSYYLWRSLWSALKLVKEGMIWRVDDGKRVEIWRDNWLPHQTHTRVQSPTSVLSINPKVDQLMKSADATWMRDLLTVMFS